MKLRATVVIDFEAKDIMDAKTRIEELQNELAPLEQKYGECELSVKERRGIRK